MKGLSLENISRASKPSDIFSMDPSTLKTEAETYLSQLKPQAYHTVENFILSQRVKTLYKQALEELNLLQSSNQSSVLCLRSVDGESFTFKYVNCYPSKIAVMYDTPTNVIYSIPRKFRQYFDNYVEKTESYPRVDRKIWQNVKYMLPKVTHHFEEEGGNLIIILQKPTSMYPLRELLDYFDGKFQAEYISSIMSRLYYFACYISLAELNHNAITVDNLFFAPGKVVEEGEPYTVDDMRIVGVFGGWFFTTTLGEQIKGMPKEVLSVCPSHVKETGYSSYEVDELSIKQLARELAGDVTGHSLDGIPEPMRTWITSSSICKDPYEEFCKWKQIEKETFGEYRFVPMDVSI